MTNNNSSENGAEPTARPMPDGYASVMPWIISANTADFLAFAREAFGAEETVRVLNADGSIGHAEAVINGSVILMFDAPVKTRSFLRLTVDDARASFDRAIMAGASSITDVTYLFWGDEVGRVRDPFGNIWWIQGHVVDVEAADLAASAAEPDNLAAMKYVQDTLEAALQ